MKLGLGIDTGGTYTDGVIYDFNSNSLVKGAKSVTVKEDLKLGIINVLDQMPEDLLKKVGMVSLSTTLATNACVEDKGSRAQLILIGCDEDTVRKNGHFYGLPPIEDIVFIEGGHDSRGDVLSEPDWALLQREVKERKGIVDSFAIVQMWGARNPEFEKQAKQLVIENTGLPVICGHELASELNFLKRGATALLNAKLIPLINEFIDAVKIALAERGIDAPLVIVCGDGSIMSEEFVRDRPVETLLSGPAASVIGGINISNQQDCVVVDMGGTTSDLAVVEDGSPFLTLEGADVGNWKTAVKSVDIRTIGLGGDSQITFDSRDKIEIGPRRAAPISWLAHRWPNVLEQMAGLYKENRIHTRSLCEFYYALWDIPEGGDFTPEERSIVKALKKGPLTVENLAEGARASLYTMKVGRLEQLGIIMKSTLTPTDIMHVTGDFSGWNSEAALMAGKILAKRLKITLDELVQEVETIIKCRLYLNIAKALIERGNTSFAEGELTPELEKMIIRGYHDSNNQNPYVSFGLSTQFSLVGIGAPIHVYLPDVAYALNTKCIIQEYASIANAVGAITGSISVKERIIIKPRYTQAGIEGYDCFSSRLKMHFDDYKEAIVWGEKEAKEIVEESARARGAGEVRISIDINENNTEINILESESQEDMEDAESTRNILLETAITAQAIGGLKWI